jgi:outer membrane biosynthesis protein TonB
MFKRVSILFLLCLYGFCAAAAQAQTEADKPLKILSKPRANYTDEARTHNIEGRVQVKITFLADGTIGEVTDVPENKEDLRKFGLVNAVIEAAKKIRFEPATKYGKPVAVTKIQIYTFTLY